MIDLDSFGVGPSRTPTQNASAIQAALDAAGGVPVYYTGETLRYDKTLKLDTNQTLRFGSIGGSSGNPRSTVLQYVGPDGTNGVEVKNPGSTSRVSIEGLRLEDARTSPTSGSGIYIDGAKNKISLRTVNVFGFPTYPIAITSSSGATSVENIELESVWVSGGARGGAGIYISNVDNVAALRNIYGDSEDAAGFRALVKIDKCAGGNAAITLDGVKAEINNGAHLVLVGPQFYASLSARGLCMRGAIAGAGGDLLRVESTNSTTNLHVDSMSSRATSGLGQVAANMVNDVGLGKVYGPAGAAVGRMTLYMRSSNKSVAFFGGVFDLTNATVADAGRP